MKFHFWIHSFTATTFLYLLWFCRYQVLQRLLTISYVWCNAAITVKKKKDKQNVSKFQNMYILLICTTQQ